MNLKLKQLSFVSLDALKALDENSLVMHGVKPGFYDSPIPNKLVDTYSNVGTIKPELRKDDKTIAQDLALRMGLQAGSKATAGAGTYFGLEAAKDHFIENPDEVDDVFTILPAAGAAIVAGSMAEGIIPKAHHGTFQDRSIYKGNQNIAPDIKYDQDSKDTSYNIGRTGGKVLGDALSGTVIGGSAGYLGDAFPEGVALGAGLGAGAGLLQSRKYFNK